MIKETAFMAFIQDIDQHFQDGTSRELQHQAACSPKLSPGL